jgi:hypothetical protein
MDTALIERLTRVEVELKHLGDNLEATRSELAKVNSTATELRDVLQQAKGAKWSLLAVAGMVGFLSGKAGTAIMGVFGGK